MYFEKRSPYPRKLLDFTALSNYPNSSYLSSQFVLTTLVLKTIHHFATLKIGSGICFGYSERLQIANSKQKKIWSRP